MQKKICASLLILGLILTTYNGSYGWGVWGHQHINRAAVLALPMSMRAFFFNHIDFITIEASIPDVRKYAIHEKNEASRHYIDLEAYGRHPFEALPETWDSAKARYGQKKLIKNGILPWYMEEMMGKLTTAFREHDKVSILFLAADLAHYIGDAHVPLHTSLNYDGQLTGQKGVHALWESLLPELFGNNYNLHVPQAKYIRDPVPEIWRMLRESHEQVQTLLSTEKKLLDSWPKNKVYETTSTGKIKKSRYGNARFTKAFASAFHEALHGMVARQMQLSIEEAANFWYTAWVNAGKPDLQKLDDAYTYRINRQPMQQQYNLWVEKGKLTGLRPEAEF